MFRFTKRLLLNICFAEYKVVSCRLESQEETTLMIGSGGMTDARGDRESPKLDQAN